MGSEFHGLECSLSKKTPKTFHQTLKDLSKDSELFVIPKKTLVIFMYTAQTSQRLDRLLGCTAFSKPWQIAYAQGSVYLGLVQVLVRIPDTDLIVTSIQKI